jgi:hypothetical protein
VRSNYLTSGHTQSCGCLNTEAITARNVLYERIQNLKHTERREKEQNLISRDNKNEVSS